MISISHTFKINSQKGEGVSPRLKAQNYKRALHFQLFNPGAAFARQVPETFGLVGIFCYKWAKRTERMSAKKVIKCVKKVKNNLSYETSFTQFRALCGS